MIILRFNIGPRSSSSHVGLPKTSNIQLRHRKSSIESKTTKSPYNFNDLLDSDCSSDEALFSDDTDEDPTFDPSKEVEPCSTIPCFSGINNLYDDCSVNDDEVSLPVENVPSNETVNIPLVDSDAKKHPDTVQSHYTAGSGVTADPR